MLAAARQRVVVIVASCVRNQERLAPRCEIVGAKTDELKSYHHLLERRRDDGCVYTIRRQALCHTHFMQLLF